jgi:hypothetical protein
MPHLATFQQGCVAAAGLFAVIERKPAQVNASSDSHDREAAADAAEMQLALAAPVMSGPRQLAPKGAHPIPAISVASLYPSSLVTFLGFHSTHDGVVLASPSQ